MKTLLIATHNQGKISEMNELLADMSITCVSLAEAGIVFDVAETGSTLRENAILKATEYAKLSGMWTLADDSGLMIDALDGAPGVYSARYGDEAFTFAERTALVLRQLEDVVGVARSAHFGCVVVVASPDGMVVDTAEGICEGRMATEPAGENGFGYDNVFYLPQLGCTMAEVSAEQKNHISHRAHALRAIAPRLQALLKS